MVMPRSRSRSLLSMTRSTSRSFERKVPVCCSSRSTSVVLPWSTCAMIAMFRMSLRRTAWPCPQPPRIRGSIALQSRPQRRTPTASAWTIPVFTVETEIIAESLLDREARPGRRGGSLGPLGRRRGDALLLHQDLAHRVLEEVELDDAQPGEHLLDVPVLEDVTPEQPARERIADHLLLRLDAVAAGRLGPIETPGVEVGEQEPARLQDSPGLGGDQTRRLGVVVVVDVPGHDRVEGLVRIGEGARQVAARPLQARSPGTGRHGVGQAAGRDGPRRGAWPRSAGAEGA